MRIVSGAFRGRTLAVPDDGTTRPTMDRTREAVFNILRSASWAMGADGAPLLQGAHILDVFAGSGAMGLEAVSQGAVSATFIEKHPAAVKIIESNLARMKTDVAIRVMKIDVVHMPQNAGKPAHIAFVDPPYNEGLIVTSLTVLQQRGWIDAKTLLVLEMHKDEYTDAPPMGMQVADTRSYGISKMVFGFLES